MDEQRLEVWRVELTLIIDRNKASKPENWDWATLIDIGGDESVTVENTEFVSDALPLNEVI